MNLYPDIILDHYQNPRNTGSLAGFTHSASEVNPFCGDGVKVQLKIENSKLKIMRYRAVGCAISIASASMLSEYVIGKNSGQVLAMDSGDVLNLLGVELTMTRVKCATLPLLAIQKALGK